jgi:hypothetical protein
MAFSMRLSNLFQGPQPSVSERATEGGAASIGQLFGKRPDPATQFIDAALSRMRADREAQYNNELFGKVGIPVPRSGGLGDLLLGLQSPNLDALKTYSTLDNAPYDNALKKAQTDYYTGGSKAMLDQAKIAALERKSLENYLPPSRQNMKDKRTAEIFETFELNRVKKNQANDVENILSTVPKGLTGKAAVAYFKNMTPDNPVLSGWQNMKDMLSEIQLDKVARTKGAISDYEMKFFATAVGNDDLTSIPRLLPIIAKYRKGMEAKERALVNGYQQMYKENPQEWDELKQFFDGTQQAPTASSSNMVVPPGFKKQRNIVTGEERIVPA